MKRPVRLAVGAGCCALVLAAAEVTRERRVGRAEVQASDAAAARRDWWNAIEHARAAAEATAPSSPYPEQGAGRLEALGRDAEGRGEAAVALLAYEALRAAAFETAAPLVDRSRWTARAEAGLARARAVLGDAPADGPARPHPAPAEPAPDPVGAELLAFTAAWVAVGAGLVGYAIVALLH